MKHISVMLHETIDLLKIKPDGIYVDATLGAGGHSEAICQQLTTGKLIGFDKDEAAIERSTKRLQAYQDKVTLVHSSYAAMKEQLLHLNIKSVDGILFDLGVSSPQFDDETRGFSYRFDSRLDMRMDTRQSLSAYEVVNTYEEKELIRILKDYGEERYAKGIVREIIKHRPVTTTFELVDCIKKAYPAQELRKGHPAKKTFQAIRIEVNNEFEELQKALQAAIELLHKDGRVVVISFHSLEDRMVKQAFNAVAKPHKVNPRLPMVEDETLNYRLISKALKASSEELSHNNRAHSAIVRGIERIR